MFPWRTVGMHAPSYSSNVLCVRKTEDSPRIQHTDTAWMTLRTTWYSSTPLRSPRCPSRGLWRTLGLSSCTNHPQHRVSTWLWPRTWAGSPLFPCFWRVTQRQRSLTCSASARIRAFRTVALTLLLQTEGGAAMSTRLTPGRGSLGLTVKETTDRKKAARDERHKRAWETRRQRKADKA
jgi:hypothetical protein